MSRAIVDMACARFGILDAIAGKSDRDVWALVAPFMGAYSLPQLRAQLQALHEEEQQHAVEQQYQQQQQAGVLGVAGAVFT